MLRGRGRGWQGEPSCLLFGWSTSSTGGRLLTILASGELVQATWNSNLHNLLNLVLNCRIFWIGKIDLISRVT